MEKVSKKKKRPAAVCVTVPHRALTAPRRVASLKSWLTPTCSTGGDADWSTPPATPAIGTTIKLSENFPRYIVRTSPTPTSVPCRGPIQRREESGIRWSLEEGRERERERERERHFRTVDAPPGVPAEYFHERLDEVGLLVASRDGINFRGRNIRISFLGDVLSKLFFIRIMYGYRSIRWKIETRVGEKKNRFCGKIR